MIALGGIYKGLENTPVPDRRQAARHDTLPPGGYLSKTMNRVTLFGALLVAALSSPTASAQRAAEKPSGAPLTFTHDIAPILYRHCATCHRPDGAAPFSLLNYEDARRRAAQIATVTASRYMPPWKPEAGFGDFAGERRLTDEEVETIDRWSKGGVLEGNPGDLPPQPRWSAGWQLGEPDLVVALPEYTLSADGADIFRNFVVTVPGTTTRYVRGFEFRPGGRAVHHANIRLDPTPASKRLDGADPAPGYEGMVLHSADYPDGHFLGWTPGQATPLSSSELAWRLGPGNDLVVQLHLQPTGKPEVLRPSIGLYFSPEPPTATPAILRLGRQDLDIAPGDAAYRASDSYVLPVDAEIRAIQPHAHYRARRVSAFATIPGAGRRPLIVIRNWDFNWQDQYRYNAPFWVPAGTKLEIEYEFDNSDQNPRNPTQPPGRVGWGWRSSDEMADVWIQVMTRTEADRLRLVADVRHKMAAEDVVGCETLVAREPDYIDLRNDTASLYLELGQPQKALTHFAAVRRLKPQSAVARYNVAVTLEALGRPADAQAEYEAAIHFDPQYSAAHNNLGSLLVSQGRIADARAHYERAVATGPANAEARNNLGAVLVAFSEFDAAIPYLREAIRLRNQYPEAHYNLARALAGNNKWAEAIDEAVIAEQQASAMGKAALAAQVRDELNTYRARVKP
jgi:tetratricopeptide (TPR) repeat protein/mono/diheme cytochrome c family protein